MRVLELAPTPTFALLAVLSAGQESTLQNVMCSGAHSSPLTGMVTMYLLMSLFHAGPWVRLATRTCASAIR
jgi:hypothetical protein